MTQKSVALFAGQGAQFIGMGRDLSEAYPVCRALFSKANDVLGYDLARLCFQGPEEELVKSNNCQPAVFVMSVACYQALQALRGEQDFSGVAGLSLGEWSALHIAGAIGFEETLRVLEARGRFMQEACNERDGAMLSVIGLAEERVRALAEEAGVQVANFNTPRQIVLSGERKQMQEAEKLAVAAGAKLAVWLKVAGAYHSSLMSSASKRLETLMQTVHVKSPCLPVLSNVTGLPHGSPDEIKRAMILQITSPVRWVADVLWFQQQGVARYVEFGPGRVLSGLVKRIQPEASLSNVQDVASLQKIQA